MGISWSFPKLVCSNFSLVQQNLGDQVTVSVVIVLFKGWCMGKIPEYLHCLQCGYEQNTPIPAKFTQYCVCFSSALEYIYFFFHIDGNENEKHFCSSVRRQLSSVNVYRLGILYFYVFSSLTQADHDN